MPESRKRILVTGGSGFIGSHVVDSLANAGHAIRVFDVRPPLRNDVESAIGSVSVLSEVQSACDGIDFIYHLAAFSNIDFVKQHPVDTVQTNIVGTLNILEAARVHKIERIILASSIYVYDEKGHLYTTSKLASEMLCRNYFTLYGLPYTVLRLGTAYGPRSRQADVISIFVKKALEGRPLVIHGSGTQNRNFIYVEDAAAACLAAVDDRASEQTYLIAGSRATSILEVAHIVSNLVSNRIDIEFSHDLRLDDHVGTVGQPRASEDLSKADMELGWRPKTSITDGIRNYIEWYRNQSSLS